MKKYIVLHDIVYEPFWMDYDTLEEAMRTIGDLDNYSSDYGLVLVVAESITVLQKADHARET